MLEFLSKDTAQTACASPAADKAALAEAEALPPREVIQKKLRANYDGKIVRKDLTKKIKEGANVPTYVLEFLLGQYCNSDDEAVVEDGVEKVKNILSANFVRPDEAEKTISLLRSKGSYTVIDKITVRLDVKHDTYLAEFSNLGLHGIEISEWYAETYDRLLCGGIWCMIQLEYEFNEEEHNETNPAAQYRHRPA